jgi:peptidoglycan hydrolase-like protein with peptidoglycan-binding domain
VTDPEPAGGAGVLMSETSPQGYVARHARARPYSPRHARARRLVGPRGAGVVTAAMLATSVGQADAHAAAPRPVPATPAGLPAGIEPFAPYQPQEICYPAPQPGVVAFERLVLRTYPETGSDGIVRECSAPGRTEHKDGRAWDWRVRASVPRERADADALLRWLLAPDAAGYAAANARRLGIMYIIWNGRMWRSYQPASGWLPYSGVDPHTGHVHFSFGWAGALGQTSFFSHRVAPPVLAPSLPLFAPGSSGPALRDLQHVLGLRKATGRYDVRTRRALVAFQRDHHLRATGLLTRATWAALLPAATPVPRPVPVRHPASVRRRATPSAPVLRLGAAGGSVTTLQRLLPVAKDGRYGPATQAAVRDFQRRSHLTVDGVAGAQTWHALRVAYTRRHTPRAPRLATPLRLGATGPAVRQLQRKLRLPVDGVFGRQTQHSVRRLQARHRLPVDGVVGARTWHTVQGLR